MLKITNLAESSRMPCNVEINSYVPISFRSCSQLIAGARYIRLGNFKTQLLELQFPPESLVLSGFTLVSCDAVPQSALTGHGQSEIGLPIISLSDGENFSGTTGISRLDIQTEINMSCVDGQAEVGLGLAKTFNRTFVHGRVQFLLLDDFLVGLRVLDLTEDERQTLSEYIERDWNR
jgi:hypothetical protein